MIWYGIIHIYGDMIWYDMIWYNGQIVTDMICYCRYCKYIYNLIFQVIHVPVSETSRRVWFKNVHVASFCHIIYIYIHKLFTKHRKSCCVREPFQHFSLSDARNLSRVLLPPGDCFLTILPLPRQRPQWQTLPGWWLVYLPLWKIWLGQLGVGMMTFPIYGFKKKHVPSHQPVYQMMTSSSKEWQLQRWQFVANCDHFCPWQHVTTKHSHGISMAHRFLDALPINSMVDLPWQKICNDRIDRRTSSRC